MNVHSNASEWRTRGALVECEDCELLVSASTGSDALRFARGHTSQTGHSVTIEMCRTRRVTPSMDSFEAFGVGEPNSFVQRTWEPGAC